MITDQDSSLLEAAVAKGYLNPGQADQLREELFMFPGSNLLSLLVRRGLLTSDQVKTLLADPTEDEDSEPDEMDMDFGPKPAPPAAPQQFKVVEPPKILRPVTPEHSAPQRPSGLHQVPTQPTAPATRSASASGVRRSVSDALGEARSALAKPAAPATPTGFSPEPQLVKLFQTGRQTGSSDLHLTPGKPPYLRQEGKLVFLEEAPLTADVVKKLALSVLTADQREELEQSHQVDFSFQYTGVGRYRANIYKQKNGMEAAFRFIPETVPTLESLNMPAVFEKLTNYPQGLNLVTGPGGCGKTTTVAAMLEYINCHRHDHIITVEDPVEYVFTPKNCQITQREVGTHTDSFAHALRTALRQDPDVIMIGELRDLETTSISITAAETGHLVFGTLHTSSAARTVARILDVYPPSQRSQICMMVAESLRGIVSQQLLPRKDGRGRVCAMEILMVTTGVSQVIKEGKTHQLVSHMQSGRKLGMKSMDDAIMELCQTGVISGATAWSAADNKSLFEMLRTQE